MGARSKQVRAIATRTLGACGALLTCAAVLPCAAVLLSVACSACSALGDKDEPVPSASTGRALPRRTNPRTNAAKAESQALHEGLRPWLGRKDETPRRLGEEHCPDETLRAQAGTDDARTLTFCAQDARFEKKDLIPLRVTRAFTSVDAPALEAELLRGAENENVKSRIAWLAARRYVGVFHVTDYAEPRWIWRLDRAKAEWVPGWIVAWLVVHDAKSGQALCSTQVHVKSDVAGAPLAARTRSETAERLTAELGSALADRAPSALAKMTSVLRAPSAEPARTAPVALAR